MLKAYKYQEKRYNQSRGIHHENVSSNFCTTKSNTKLLSMKRKSQLSLTYANFYIPIIQWHSTTYRVVGLTHFSTFRATLEPFCACEYACNTSSTVVFMKQISLYFVCVTKSNWSVLGFLILIPYRTAVSLRFKISCRPIENTNPDV